MQECAECEILKGELAEFESVSKELQIELERDLASLEKSELSNRLASERARGELDNLQGIYNQKLRDHSITVAQLTKELDLIRTNEQKLSIKLRDIELDNDDLEKSERANHSSLQDFEARYNRAIERIALLEEELVDKALLEEELQRFKDQLRDQEEEMEVIRNQQLTPPRTESVTTTSPTASESIENVTPRKSASAKSEMKRSNSLQDTSTSPSIALTSATPAPPIRSSSLSQKQRSPPAPKSTDSPIPPLPSFRNSINSSSQVTSQATPLSRSFRAVSNTPTSTSSVVRERTHRNVLNEMKGMTSRIQQLTTKRNLNMASSGIPRASLSSPTSTRVMGIGRNSEAKRMISLGLSIPAGTKPGRVIRTRPSVEAEDDGNLNGIGNENRHSRTTSIESSNPPSLISRPASRTSMRMSMSGVPSTRTSIPIRSSSRLSNYSPPPPIPTRSIPSRSSTPTSTRPTTPSNLNRKPWGSNLSNPPPPVNNNLGQSTRRRLLSTTTTTPARIRGCVDLNAESTTEEKSTNLTRRASTGLSLSKSIRR